MRPLIALLGLGAALAAGVIVGRKTAPAVELLSDGGRECDCPQCQVERFAAEVDDTPEADSALAGRHEALLREGDPTIH